MGSRRISFVILFFLFVQHCSSQQYPKWFLQQGEINCPGTVVGFANISFFPDSSVSRAVLDGCETYSAQSLAEIKGGQAFWSTEIGTFWMGSNYQEIYDTSAASLIKTQINVIDTLFAGNFTAVLISPSDCFLENRDRTLLSLSKLQTPGWTEAPPKDNQYYYGVGVAPEYYYEISSWKLAEKLARRSLARMIYIEVKALQKMARSGQEIRNEDLVVTLHHVKTIARWRDLRKRIVYVLVRMPKK